MIIVILFFCLIDISYDTVFKKRLEENPYTKGNMLVHIKGSLIFL